MTRKHTIRPNRRPGVQGNDQGRAQGPRVLYRPPGGWRARRRTWRDYLDEGAAVLFLAGVWISGNLLFAAASEFTLAVTQSFN